MKKDVEHLTIGRLARAAEVGIETIRYYQKLNLLPTPVPNGMAFRQYPLTLVKRIRFIKRSQDLGFTLSEIASLLSLEDGNDRAAIRGIANVRLNDINKRIADLERMQSVLRHLILECEMTGQTKPCPIISAFTDGTTAH
jgi:Hg(II)-responsive transcriptional regulator